MYLLVTIILLLLCCCIGTDGADLPWSVVLPKDFTVKNRQLSEITRKICPSVAKCNTKQQHLPNYKFHTRDECLDSKCVCDTKCHIESNCCSNRAVSYLKTSCVNLISQPNTRIRNDVSFIMVSECPSPTDTYAELCMENNPAVPVYSQTSKLTYTNAYCALCHGEETYVEWTIMLGCANPSYTTSMSLPEQVSSRKCDIIYKPPNIPRSYIRCSIPTTPMPNIIRQCNETGLWKNYNIIIEWGCTHLNQRYLHFKNVFCYICNPSLLSVSSLPEAIVDCPPSIDGTETDELCTSTPKMQRLYPYKNIYCLECNKNAERMETFGFKILETVPKSTKAFILNFIVNSTGNNEQAMIQNLSKILNTLQGHFGTLPNTIGVARQTKLLQFGDTSNFLAGLLSQCGEHSVCMPNEPKDNSDNTSESISNTIFPQSKLRCANCSCDDNCYLSLQPGTRCCLDKILSLQPYSCMNNFPVLQTGTKRVNYDAEIVKFKVIDTCLNSNDTSTVNLCEDGGSDFMTQVPVRNLETGSIFFKNIYCMLCNVGVQDLGIYLKIECDTYFETDIILEAMMFLIVAKEHGCRVIFTLPNIERDMCYVMTEYGTFEHVCFNNGTWKNDTCGNGQCDRPLAQYSVLESLQEMCDHKIPYKALNIMLDTTTQGTIQPMICVLRPPGESENVIKEMCEDDKQGVFKKYGMLLNLSGQQYTMIAALQRQQVECSTRESLDMETFECRPMLCTGDRVLRGDSCVHLIETGNNILYIIRTGFYVDTNYFVSHQEIQLRMIDLCDNAVSGIKATVHNITAGVRCETLAYPSNRCRMWPVGYYMEYTSLNGPVCEDGFSDGGYIILDIIFHVRNTNERTLLENNIVEWLDSFEVSYENINYDNIPILMTSHTEIGICKQEYMFETFVVFGLNDQIFLKKTTICPMVAILVDEIIFNVTSATFLSLELSQTKVFTISLSSLKHLGDKTYGICKDDYDVLTMFND